MLHTITEIPVVVLLSDTQVQCCSVAQRMSCAATRQTTRVEDRAYSLMGLFDIFMPIIYGEGAAAFTRLQLEIIQRSDDQTIFAWPDVKPKVGVSRQLRLIGHEEYERQEYSLSRSSVLATSPAGFEHSGHIVHLISLPSISFGKTEFSSTNLGIRIRVPLVSMQLGDGGVFLWVLPCLDEAEDFICGIMLRSDEPSLDSFQSHGWQSSTLLIRHNQPQDRLVRIPVNEYYELARRVDLRTIYISIYVSASGGRRSYHSAPTSTQPTLYRRKNFRAFGFQPLKYARLLVILGKPILVNLQVNGYLFAGYASLPDSVESTTKDWKVEFNAAGDLLLEYRLDMEDLSKLYPKDDYGIVLNHKECVALRTSHIHVLFRNHDKKLAFSLLVARPRGGRSLLIEAAGHSNHRINTDDVCDQYNHGRRVETTRITRYNSVEKIRYTTYWINASFNEFFAGRTLDLSQIKPPATFSSIPPVRSPHWDAQEVEDPQPSNLHSNFEDYFEGPRTLLNTRHYTE